MEKPELSHHDLIVQKLIALSSEEFLDLGTDGMAYIKPLDIDDGTDGVVTYALHAANGSHIATGQDIALLRTIAGQNDLTAMSLQ